MYREKIDAFIDAHRSEMIEDICELCRINSEKMPAEEDMPFGPGAAECLDTALDMAEGYGFEVLEYDGYVGCVDMNEKPRQLDILAHLDVVPAGEGWRETEPFDPVERDGRLFGRGTADDKGPAVAALYAMRAVKELGIPLERNVRLILGTDEECGSSDIKYYYGIEKEAPMTFSPDAEFPVTNIEKGRLQGHFAARCVPSATLPRLNRIEAGTKVNVVPGKAKAVVEGMDMTCLQAAANDTSAETGVKILIESQGSVCTITVTGAGAHGSKPEDGNNALTGLLVLLGRLPFAPCEQIELVKKLAALMPHGDVNGTTMGVDMRDDISGRLTLAFTMLTVDTFDVDGQFDCRIPVCGTKETVLDVIKARMKEQGITLLNDSMVPPHHVDGDSLFVKTLLNVYEEYTGEKGECQSTGGGTYVHELENGVAFGASMPGTDNRMHGADEYAIVEDLVTSAKIFAMVIVRLCQ